MHLERYLKVTNQYLHATLDGANLTSNEQINHLIRTNILTNKIAANNLISIINKLLEQNIISEYYFKHASRLMMQSYENVTATASNFPESNLNANDKDSFDLFDKSKLSPTQNTSTHQPSELLKELIKQRDLRFSAEDDDGDASDSETIDNPQKVELLDYDDTIKKETIPVHANPFMSYLHMHLNRSLDKSKTDNKYFNGTSIPIPNSVSPTDSTSLSPLIAPIEGKSKSHKKRANNQSAASNNFNNNNNNNSSHTKSSSRNSRYDLALNLSQRLFHLIPPTVLFFIWFLSPTSSCVGFFIWFGGNFYLFNYSFIRTNSTKYTQTKCNSIFIQNCTGSTKELTK